MINDIIVVTICASISVTSDEARFGAALGHHGQGSKKLSFHHNDGDIILYAVGL